MTGNEGIVSFRLPTTDEMLSELGKIMFGTCFVKSEVRDTNYGLISSSVGVITHASPEGKVEDVFTADNLKLCDILNSARHDYKWHHRFMDLGNLVSTWSKDPSTKVGAVIVDNNRRVISTGYNGFAVGVDDTEARLTDRTIKYPIILHAEENAIMFARRDLTGCSLYVTNLPPCAHCASLICQAGIKNVYAVAKEIPDRWRDSYNLTKKVFAESHVNLTFIYPKLEEG